MRIRVLTRAVKQAYKLYNTGGYPQATYGYEAYGMSLSMVYQLRALTHLAVSSDARGQCACTNIALTIGQQHDPLVKCAIGQNRSWWELINSVSPCMTKLARVWYGIRGHVLSASDNANKWARVRGPIGAVIATLHDMYWNPVSPTTWIDHEGIAWEVDYRYKPMELLRKMTH